MTTLQQTVLSLIRIALSGRAEALPAGVDWPSVARFLTRHGLAALCIDAVEKLGPDSQPPFNVLMQLLGQASYVENRYAQSWQVAGKLAELWAEAGISASVIKGRSIAQFYPVPAHRYSCDLDLFIAEGWTEACRLLEQKGIRLEYEVYKEAEFSLDGVAVECHRFITPVRGNSHLQRVERYLRKLLQTEPSCFDGSLLIRPPLDFTAMLFIEHALGDLQQGTFSLKHIVDWVILRKQSVDWADFRSRCAAFRFDRFLRLIDALADVVEGKSSLEELPASYQQVFREVFSGKPKKLEPKSWTGRRLDLFRRIIRHRRYYTLFGYCSMPRFLLRSLLSHFFSKDVSL